MAEFKIPAFLENQSVEEIHGRMMDNLPDDIETAEGGHNWNLTMPAAYEKAYMAEYMLPEIIKLILPMFCEDYAEQMEYHAATRGLTRKQAEYATGTITVTGPAETEIPSGSTFSTVGINDEPSIDFYTTEDAVIGEDGTVDIPIKAVEEGLNGNVPANTIVLNASEIDDITSVNNETATTGGIEIETIESLQARINEKDATEDESWGGSITDYKRWALEVNGTGQAIIIEPEDDTGYITIVLTDAQGNPASETLCTAVYNHIMKPDDPENKLAVINDKIKVVAPSTITMTVSATIELSPGHTIAQAKALFIEEAQKYILEAAAVGEIRYSKINGIISALPVVADHKDLLINGATENIAITDSQIPSVTEAGVTFTEGTV